jgi:hypothetical protein
MPARHLFFWSLPLACTLAMPLPLSAAVTLPDIVVTSTGAVLNVGEDYFRSGVDTSIGLGSVAPAFFAGGPVAQGEQVSLTIRGAPGTVFSLTPESMGLSLLFDFQGAENELSQTPKLEAPHSPPSLAAQAAGRSGAVSI